MSAPKAPYTVKEWQEGHLSRGNDDWRVIYDAEDRPVALCVNDAVAREMAAAPEMREALAMLLLSPHACKEEARKVRDAARAALAKAGTK